MQPVGVCLCCVFLEGRSAVTTDSHLAAARLRGARGGWHTLLSFPFISFTSRGSIIPHTQCSLKRVRTLSVSVSSAVFAHCSSISSSGAGSTVSLSSNPSIAALCRPSNGRFSLMSTRAAGRSSSVKIRAALQSWSIRLLFNNSLTN